MSEDTPDVGYDRDTLFHLDSAIGQLRLIEIVHEGEKRSARASEFLGTTFSFLSSDCFLTAAHCIPDVEPWRLGVLGHFDEDVNFCFVREVVKHPTADLAVLRMYESDRCKPDPFRRLRQIHYRGDEFSAFGFPADVFGVDASKPVSRFFKGYFQRFYEHHSHLDFEYAAAELSIAAPAGLSGGPVFSVSPMTELIGLVTENLQSSTFLYSEEFRERSGAVTKERYQTVINYGVCLVLSPYEEWLHETIRAEIAPGA